jgi:hypothetical protein
MGMEHDNKTKEKQERQKKNLTPLAEYTRLDKTKDSPTYTRTKRTTSRHYTRTRRNEFITQVKIKVRNTYLRGNYIEFAIGL